MVSMIAGVLFIVAAVFAYLVVDAIDKRQEETTRKLHLGKFAAPPPPVPPVPTPEVVTATSSPLDSQVS